MSRATIALAVASVTVLLGCGEDADSSENAVTVPTSTTTSTSPGSTSATSTTDPRTFNETDVFFAELMLPHHRQALTMAGLAYGAGASTEVLALANRIVTAKEPEINLLTLWLIDWGEGAPAGTDGTDHGSMGHERVPGMMTEEELTSLGAARGAEFDRMFLTTMITHHEGAVLMATIELADGEHAGALDLAARIEVDQLAEIAQMEEMLS